MQKVCKIISFFLRKIFYKLNFCFLKPFENTLIKGCQSDGFDIKNCYFDLKVLVKISTNIDVSCNPQIQNSTNIFLLLI